MKRRICRKCGDVALDSSICEDCEKKREERVKRKAQPADPTIYVPTFNGIGACEDDDELE